MNDMIHKTPMGHILKAMTSSNWHQWSYDEPSLREAADIAVDGFLYDLSADGLVAVINGKVIPIRKHVGYGMWSEVEDEGVVT